MPFRFIIAKCGDFSQDSNLRTNPWNNFWDELQTELLSSHDMEPFVVDLEGVVIFWTLSFRSLLFDSVDTSLLKTKMLFNIFFKWTGSWFKLMYCKYCSMSNSLGELSIIWLKTLSFWSSGSTCLTWKTISVSIKGIRYTAPAQLTVRSSRVTHLGNVDALIETIK